MAWQKTKVTTAKVGADDIHILIFKSDSVMYATVTIKHDDTEDISQVFPLNDLISNAENVTVDGKRAVFKYLIKEIRDAALPLMGYTNS